MRFSPLLLRGGYMAYVTPNSDIEIFKNIPWDNTYEHTLYFVGQGNNTASYYQNLVFTAMYSIVPLRAKYGVKKYSAYSYQRKNKNTIKLNEHPDDIYNYNYMRFKNTSHGNKWFYAFINDVEYVNENTALIHYEIDVLQTYIDEMIFKESFVERKHTTTDIIGENLEPEPLDFGDYVNLTSETPWNFQDYELIMFVASADKNDVDVKSVVCEVTKEVDTDLHVSHYTFSFIDPEFGTTVVEFHDHSGTINNIPYTFTNGILTIQTDDDVTVPADELRIAVSSFDYGDGSIGNVQFYTGNISVQSGGTVTFNLYHPIV